MSVFNFHLVSQKELFSCGIIESVLSKIDLKAKVSYICSINNWKWEEEQVLNCQKEVLALLLQERIIVVYFDAREIDNFGMYIEKKGPRYIYSFWWHADEDAIAFLHARDRKLFQYFQSASLFKKMEYAIAEYCKDFSSIAFGEETVYNYSECTEKMIETSSNITFWLLKNSEVLNSISSLEEIAEIPSLEARLFRTIN